MKKFVLLLSAILLLSLTSCVTHVHRKPVHTVVVKTPPKHYKIVKVKGKRYYFWNGKHHKKTRKGFVIVKV